MTEEERAAAAPAEIRIHPAQKVDARTANRRNVGCAAVLGIYNALGVERALRNHAARSRADYDLNAVMRLLVVERILGPGSKRGAYAGRDGYFFRCDFTEDDMCRALDALAAARDSSPAAEGLPLQAERGRDMLGAQEAVLLRARGQLVGLRP